MSAEPAPWSKYLNLGLLGIGALLTSGFAEPPEPEQPSSAEAVLGRPVGASPRERAQVARYRVRLMREHWAWQRVRRDKNLLRALRREAKEHQLWHIDHNSRYP